MLTEKRKQKQRKKFLRKREEMESTRVKAQASSVMEKIKAKRALVVKAYSVMKLIAAYRPSFRNSHDKLAFAVHASFLNSGYSLTQVGNVDRKIPHSDDGMKGWNELGKNYEFAYKMMEKDSEKIVTVRCAARGDNLEINILRLIISKGKVEDFKLSWDLRINVHDFVDAGSSSTDYSAMYKDFPVLVKLLDLCILENLDVSEMHNSFWVKDESFWVLGEGLNLSFLRIPEETSSTYRSEAIEGSEHTPNQPSVVAFPREPQPQPQSIRSKTSKGSEHKPNIQPAVIAFFRGPQPQPQSSSVSYLSVPPTSGISDRYRGPCFSSYNANTREWSSVDARALVGRNYSFCQGGMVGDEQPSAFTGGISDATIDAGFDRVGPPDVSGSEPGQSSSIPMEPGSGTDPELESFMGSDNN